MNPGIKGPKFIDHEHGKILGEIKLKPNKSEKEEYYDYLLKALDRQKNI